jgi:hypothetical protein
MHIDISIAWTDLHEKVTADTVPRDLPLLTSTSVLLGS